MSIHENTLVSVLDPDSVGQSQEKTVLLPGRTEDEQKISERQLATIVRYVKRHYEPTMTWAAAITDLRRKAGIKGDSRDFGMVGYCMKVGYRENADQPMSVRQEEIAADLYGVLKGTQRHFDSNIQAAVEQASREDRDESARDFRRARTMGDFSHALLFFEKTFGKLTREQRGDDDAGAGTSGAPELPEGRGAF